MSREFSFYAANFIILLNTILVQVYTQGFYKTYYIRLGNGNVFTPNIELKFLIFSQ